MSPTNLDERSSSITTSPELSPEQIGQEVCSYNKFVLWIFQLYNFLISIRILLKILKLMRNYMSALTTLMNRIMKVQMSMKISQI